MNKKLVYVCSPLKGNIEENINKAKGYCKEVIEKGFIPIAPHIYFTQFLNDLKEEERKMGIECGMELLKLCDELWVYGDYTKSEGMTAEINWWKDNRGTSKIKLANTNETADKTFLTIKINERAGRGTQEHPCRDIREVQTAIIGRTNCHIYTYGTFKTIPTSLNEELKSRNIKLVGLAVATIKVVDHLTNNNLINETAYNRAKRVRYMGGQA